MRFKILLLIVLALLTTESWGKTPAPAKAQTVSKAAPAKPAQPPQAKRRIASDLSNDFYNDLPRYWWLFAGVDLGFSTLSTSISGEEGKSGLGGTLRFMASRYWDNWVFDGGFGFAYKNISGVRPNGFEGVLETRTLNLEFGFRYRVTPRWEAGLFLGAHTLADVSHRPTEQPLVTEPEKSLIFMTGLQGLYDLSSGSTPIRVGLRLGTDLDIPNRQLVEIQAVFQIGFPIYDMAPAPAAAPLKDSKPVEFFEIPYLRIFFKLDSDELVPESIPYLQKLGQFFKKHTASFSRIEVEGHTDRSGGYIYNVDLSQRRADAVAAVFRKEGVPGALLLTKGYGYNKPLSDQGRPGVSEPEKNRRVIVRLFGSNPDKAAFTKEIEELTK